MIFLNEYFCFVVVVLLLTYVSTSSLAVHTERTFIWILLSISICFHPVSMSVQLWVMWSVSIWPLAYQTEVSSQFSASLSLLLSPCILRSCLSWERLRCEGRRQERNRRIVSLAAAKTFIVEDRSGSPALPVTSCLKHEIAKNLS